MPENDPDGYERSPLDDALEVPGPAVREATGQEYWRGAVRPVAQAVGLGPLVEPTQEQIASRVDLNKARSLGLDPASTDKIFLDRRARAAEAQRVLAETKTREETNKRLMSEKAAINRAQRSGEITAEEAAAARSQLEQSAQPEQGEFAGALANRTQFDAPQPGQAQFARLDQPRAMTPALPQLAGYRGFGDLSRQSQQAQAGFQGALEETGEKLGQAGALRRDAATKAARADLERVDAVKDLYAERDAALSDFEADQREADAFRDEAIAASKESIATARQAVRDHPDIADRRGIGTKIRASIAMALGAFGSALTGGPNAAMQIVNDGIEQDLEEQREALAKKEGVLAGAQNELGQLMREHGDQKKAELLYRDQMLERGKARLEEIQATVGMDEQTEARLLDMHAQITEQQAQGELELEKHHVQAANQAIGDRAKFRQAGNQIAGMRNRDAAAIMAARAKAAEKSGSRNPIPGTTWMGEGPPDKEAIKVIRGKKSATLGFANGIDKLMKRVKEHGTEIIKGKEAGHSEAILNNLIMQYGQAYGQGAMGDSEFARYKESFGDPSGWRTEKALAQLQAMKDAVVSSYIDTAYVHNFREDQLGAVTGEAR